MDIGNGNKRITRADKHVPVTVDIDLTRIREELLVIGARLALRARSSINDFGHPPDHPGTTTLAGMSRSVMQICEDLASIPDFTNDWIKSRALEDRHALSHDDQDALAPQAREASHTPRE